jgi:hypothetical protein
MASDTELVLASSLLPGDSLLLTGRSVFSRLVSFIEGTSFDHIALVAPPNLDDPVFGRGAAHDRTSEPWIVDVGFDGGRWKPLSAYDDPPTAVSVRRHRHAGASDFAVPRAIAIATETDAYAWDQLLFVCLVGITKWSDGLSELGPRLSGAFMTALFELLSRVRTETTSSPSPRRRICGDLVMEAFDVIGNAPIDSKSPAPYFGLVTPPIRQDGLLWWAASVEKFADFVASDRPQQRASVLDNDASADLGVSGALRLLQELSFETGGTFAGLDEFDEERLRSVVVDGCRRTLHRLVVDARVGDLDAIADPRRLAWFLLDVMLRRRTVITPADLCGSPSLFDVGRLDLSSIEFKKVKTQQ